jgi:5,5'-dehydrodivanillate O-demethylase
MLSAEENKRIAEVGPGTPAGNWLRRYWHPVAISDAWDGQRGQWDWDEPVLFDGKSGTSGSWGAKLGTFGGKPTPVRILGEDLVLFRDGSGNPGLIQRTCPHRGTSFEFGRIHEDGIQCCYHGWLFDVGGACLAMPAEPADSTFKEKVRITSYPVQEMGGLLWAYMGPGEAPVLPRFDVYAEDAGVRVVENFGLWPTNYFQICEPASSMRGRVASGSISTVSKSQPPLGRRWTTVSRRPRCGRASIMAVRHSISCRP